MSLQRCAFCGRLTVPYLMIGAEAVGPTCARKHGLTKAKAGKFLRIRFVEPAGSRREKHPETLDMFADLESQK